MWYTNAHGFTVQSSTSNVVDEGNEDMINPPSKMWLDLGRCSAYQGQVSPELGFFSLRECKFLTLTSWDYLCSHTTYTTYTVHPNKVQPIHGVPPPLWASTQICGHRQGCSSIMHQGLWVPIPPKIATLHQAEHVSSVGIPFSHEVLLLFFPLTIFLPAVKL